jgi:diguanylate cyclase (GGDEF)-like protein
VRILDRGDRTADAFGVKDPRTALIAVATVGLALGIAALAFDVPALGLIAGLTGVVVCALALRSPRPGPLDRGPAVSSPTTAPVPATAAAGGPGLVDSATGLYNGDYFKVAVETRILAARRHLRPVAVVLFDVIDGLGAGATTQADAVPVSAAIRHTLREADTACRLADGRYGFVLEDTPEDGAIWTVERLRRKLSEYQPEQTRWAGIACYPAHAFSADEVMAKAETAFAAAREWAQDRIEVAATE